VEDLGSEQRWAAENQLERMIEHPLKLEHPPNPAPRLQWMICAIDPRGEIDRRMTATIRREVGAGSPGPLPSWPAEIRTGAARS
jgi:hypothetical protein